MSGDYSRWTFDPRNDTVAVLQQQGRLWTDADWNEQATAAGRRTQAESLDVVGRAGIGLDNVRQRTAAVGGTMAYANNASGGVTVTLEIPT